MKKYNFKFYCIIAVLVFSMLNFSSCEKDEEMEVDHEVEMGVDNYVQIATGQTTFYDGDGEVLSTLNIGDAFYGQDASYLKGKPMSYTDNGDGTILDNNTGLMWQQIPSSDKMTWDEAEAYCDSLELNGYDDWRMPNIKELFSISDFSSGWPYIDTDYFSLASGMVDKSEQFWSSNKYVGWTVEGQYNAAFGVNHVTGHIKAYPAGGEMPDGGGDGTPPDGGDGTPPDGGDGTPPDGSLGNPLAKYVRAVRGDSYGINDFLDNNDGTITDNSTGLMWSQDDDGTGVDWEAALAYCENSELAGYSDWRLPNVKVLQTIVDYNYAPGAEDPSFDGPAIDPMFICTPRVNESGTDGYGYYWTGTSANFTSGQPYYYAWYVAFGRAVNDEGLDFHGAGAVRFDTKHENGPAGEDAERYYNFVRLVRNVN